MTSCSLPPQHQGHGQRSERRELRRIPRGRLVVQELLPRQRQPMAASLETQRRVYICQCCRDEDPTNLKIVKIDNLISDVINILHIALLVPNDVLIQFG